MSDDKKIIFSMSGVTKTYKTANTPVLKNIHLSFFYGAKIGILGADILKKYRKHSLVAILILSALITPPDVVSQLMVSFPIYALYEFGIIIVKRVEKKRLRELRSDENLKKN